MSRNFSFGDERAGRSSGAVCIVVPKSVSSKADLLAALSRSLSFPDTFGANWDALFDCLCDLSWVQEMRVVIAHENVPALPADDLRAYLDTLGDAVASWQDRPGAHELVVMFPKDAASIVA